MDEMSKEVESLKYWERIGYAIFAVAIGGAAWALGRAAQLEGGDWAGWVQAVGTIAAIIGAHFLGEHQAKATLSNAIKLQRIEVKRKSESLLAVAAVAHGEVSNFAAAYHDQDPSEILVHLIFENKSMDDLIDALAAIPAHELGTYEAVSAFLQMRKSFIYLRRHLQRDDDFFEQAHTMDHEDFARKRRDITNLIRTNCRLVDRYYRELQKALASQEMSLAK